MLKLIRQVLACDRDLKGKVLFVHKYSMNKYIATVRIRGTSVKTVVFADSSTHARLILQYQFGMDSISSSPSLLTREHRGYISLEEAIAKIQPIKPLTPEQGRIEALKRQKETAAKALKAERERQRVSKAQKTLFNLSR